MPWVFNTKYVLVPILILGSLFILHSRESARGATGEDFESMILETDHLADLFPHEHDAGEAVEDKGHHHYLYSPIVVADRDLWIASTTFKIMNAPDTTVHHASLVAVNREHQNCKQWPFEELVQFGQDNMHAPSVVFPSGTGMQIEKGEAYRLVLMVHNPLPPVGPGGVYHNVYGTLTFSLHRDTDIKNLKLIHSIPLHLDQAPCQGVFVDGTPNQAFVVPPKSRDFIFRAGSSTNNPGRFTFVKPATIVFVYGHLHGWQGGKGIFVEKNGYPFLFFKAVPSSVYPYRYDGDSYPTAIYMNAGDRLSVGAIYDNPNSVPTRGAMGIFNMYYYDD